MKRFFLLVVPILVLSTLFLSGCGLEEIDREKELKSALETISEELESNFSGSDGEYALISEYLESWANKNELNVEKSTDNYMVINNPATKGYKNSEATTLQCQIDTKDFSNSLHTLSVALTSLMGPEQHGDIKLIVTENNKGHLTGASAIDKKYADCDNFINLKYGDEALLFTNGCYSIKSSMTSNIKTTSPSYKNAYKITFKTTSYSDPFNFDKHYPNPIETVGSLLATEKSSGQLFQLASFTCDTTEGYTPQSATAIVVIDNNDIDSFTNRFDSSYEKIKKRYEKLEENFVYTMTETSIPETVMDHETSDNIISLMYTLKTGIYLQDEDSGEIISASDISYVNTDNGKFTLKMNSRSSDENTLKEMQNVFLTTSGLCEIKYKSSDIKITWSSDKNKNMATFFTEALGSEDYIRTSSLRSDENDIISSKVDGVNMISYSFDASHGEPAMLNIVHFMESLLQ